MFVEPLVPLYQVSRQFPCLQFGRMQRSNTSWACPYHKTPVFPLCALVKLSSNFCACLAARRALREHLLHPARPLSGLGPSARNLTACPSYPRMVACGFIWYSSVNILASVSFKKPPASCPGARPDRWASLTACGAREESKLFDFIQFLWGNP